MDILHAGLAAAVAEWTKQEDWLPYPWKPEVADAKTSLEEFNLDPGTYALIIDLGRGTVIGGTIITRCTHREVEAIWEIGDMSNSIGLAPPAGRLIEWVNAQDGAEPAATPPKTTIQYEYISVPEAIHLPGRGNVQTRRYVVRATLPHPLRSGYEWNVLRITEDGELLEVAAESSREDALFGFIEQK